MAESADKKLEFTYDYMGRRVDKKVYSGSVGNWTLSKHERFVYDGYKCIEVLDALNRNAITKKFIWQPENLGLDVVLSMTDSDSEGATFFCTHDANKNTSELIDATGTIRAHYEYSPFGKITVQTGEEAAINPFRFSSEFHDTETALIYYNFRYYSLELGRWTKRDPIEEKGNVLLNEPRLTSYNIFSKEKVISNHNEFELFYVYVKNSPSNYFDNLGLASSTSFGGPCLASQDGNVRPHRICQGCRISICILWHDGYQWGKGNVICRKQIITGKYYWRPQKTFGNYKYGPCNKGKCP